MIVLHIEYCERWNYEPEFDRVSKIILNMKKEIKIIGNETIPRTGSFEVLLNNKLVFSKLQNNNFPTIEDINSWFY